MDQVRNMMLVTVFVFIRIEGASVYSARAEKRSDVGRATVIGFLGVLALLVLVNVLSLGIMSQPELANLQNLWSTAYAALLSGRGETYENAPARRLKDAKAI